MPISNFHNYFNPRRLVANMYEWAFAKTGDMRLLDKAVEYAYAALGTRNDHETRYTMSIYGAPGTVAPWWLNHKSAAMFKNTLVTKPGASIFARSLTLT